jgi:hypothetical protein
VAVENISGAFFCQDSETERTEHTKIEMLQ